MSTEPVAPGGRAASGTGPAVPEAGDRPQNRHFDPWRRYQLSPNVSLRPEPFGALAYHFGNRRLSFLKTPTLVAIVETLQEHESVRDALSAHNVLDEQQPGYLRALSSLVDSDMIIRC